jgi:hypothetical protein
MQLNQLINSLNKCNRNKCNRNIRGTKETMLFKSIEKVLDKRKRKFFFGYAGIRHLPFLDEILQPTLEQISLKQK